MKIIYITQYFPPEVGAGAVRAFNITKNLIELGNNVFVISEIPNYPDGKIPPKYRHKFFYKERYEGIDVLRTYVVASKRKTFLQRFLFYLSFMFSSIYAGLRLIKFDLVFATSPPLFVGLSGYFISKIRNAKFLLDIRDLWPETAVAFRQLSNKCLIYLLVKLERFLYREADRVTTPIPGYCDKIGKSTSKKVIHLPRSINLTFFKTSSSQNELKRRYHWSKK